MYNCISGWEAGWGIDTHPESLNASPSLQFVAEGQLYQTHGERLVASPGAVRFNPSDPSLARRKELVPRV